MGSNMFVSTRVTSVRTLDPGPTLYCTVHTGGIEAQKKKKALKKSKLSFANGLGFVKFLFGRKFCIEQLNTWTRTFRLEFVLSCLRCGVYSFDSLFLHCTGLWTVGSFIYLISSGSCLSRLCLNCGATSASDGSASVASSVFQKSRMES